MKRRKVLAKPAKSGSSQESASHIEPSRREFLAGLTGAAVVTALNGSRALAQTSGGPLNIARVAVPSSLDVTSWNDIATLNDGFEPESSFDRHHGCYALGEPGTEGNGPSWVQYDWSRRVTINKMEVYWAVDRPRPGALPGSSLPRMVVPASYRILYWNGKNFAPVEKPQGLAIAADQFQRDDLRPVTAAGYRGYSPKGRAGPILEWRCNHGPVQIFLGHQPWH